MREKKSANFVFFSNPKYFFFVVSSCFLLRLLLPLFFSFFFLSEYSVRLKKEYAVALSLSLSFSLVRREEDCEEEEGFRCS